MKYNAQEIVNNLTSCSKDEYRKSEILPQLMGLQAEIVSVAFPEMEPADRDNMRLWDVVELLEARAANVGAGSDEVAAFKESSKQVGHEIAGHVSGNRGERKAFWKLESLPCEKALVKNVELEVNGIRSEIDCAVITESCAFIVEVKNTKRDVFIDEDGNVFRVGKFNRFDCNLRDKMRLREELLTAALEQIGFKGIPVKSVVVYTDSHIEVHNCCKDLDTCFLNQLTWLIKDSLGSALLSSSEIEQARVGLEAMGAEWTYPLEVDMAMFKQQFAQALVATEKASKPVPAKLGFAARLSAALTRLALAVNPDQQVVAA